MKQRKNSHASRPGRPRSASAHVAAGPANALQRAEGETLAGSPRLAAQQQRIGRLFGPAAQLREQDGVAQRDPIEDTVLDDDSDSVRDDVNAAMAKIRTLVLQSAKDHPEVAKALHTHGRDALVYAPIMSWTHDMLALIEKWDNTWSVEDTSGLLLDMGLVMRKFSNETEKTRPLMNDVMKNTRTQDKRIDKDSTWAQDLPEGTQTQAGVSATTGNLLQMLRSMDVNTPLEIEAIMNGIIKYWKGSYIKQMTGDYHTAVEVWATYTFHLEHYAKGS